MTEEEQLPALADRQERVQTILRNEEEFFWRAVGDGKRLFASKFKKVRVCVVSNRRERRPWE